MSRELSPVDLGAMKAQAEAAMVAWISANRLPGETFSDARIRYRPVRAAAARADLQACVAAVRAARANPTHKEDRVLIRPAASPLRRWLASVRGAADPLRAPSLVENALDHSAADLIRDH